MGRQKTKYTRTDASIYIISVCVLEINNHIINIMDQLECTKRQLLKYIEGINLAFAEFRLSYEIVLVDNKYILNK